MSGRQRKKKPKPAKKKRANRASRSRVPPVKKETARVSAAPRSSASLSQSQGAARMVEHSDGRAGFEADLSKVPLPVHAFSADSVLVSYIQSSKCVNVFFIGASASGTSVKSVVRVRFSETALQAQLKRDQDFIPRLESYVDTTQLGTPWAPEIEELDDVAHRDAATFEGTVMALAHWGESAVCDIFRVPPDFASRERAGASWDIEGVLRVNIPTNILHHMLQEISRVVSGVQE